MLDTAPPLPHSHRTYLPPCSGSDDREMSQALNLSVQHGTHGQNATYSAPLAGSCVRCMYSHTVRLVSCTTRMLLLLFELQHVKCLHKARSLNRLCNCQQEDSQRQDNYDKTHPPLFLSSWGRQMVSISTCTHTALTCHFPGQCLQSPLESSRRLGHL